ncbi:MAG: hypothetical protein ACI8UR_002236 [Natronomonas sp.]|jgi:hypothetical protein
MDSASPIAQRTAGATAFDAGINFTFAMWTNKAEKLTTGRTSTGPSRGHRGEQYRPYGEGHSA